MITTIQISKYAKILSTGIAKVLLNAFHSELSNIQEKFGRNKRNVILYRQTQETKFDLEIEYSICRSNIRPRETNSTSRSNIRVRDTNSICRLNI